MAFLGFLVVRSVAAAGADGKGLFSLDLGRMSGGDEGQSEAGAEGRGIRCAAAISGLPDGGKAAGIAAARCGEHLGDGDVDLAMVFFSKEHADSADEIGERVRGSLRPRALIGVSCEGVVGGAIELERTPGVSVLALRMPGVRVRGFNHEALVPYSSESPETIGRVGSLIDAGPDLRAVVLLADPFSVPIGRMLPALNLARGEGSSAAVIGGMASSGRGHGENRLILDDQVMGHGLVGVSISGPIEVETVVSQGCRAIGPTLVVTAASRNVILKLGGRPALDVVREVVERLSEEERKLLEKGLFVGRVINEYKDRFGRDDFLIRNVLGVEESQGAIAINEVARVGTTVRLHLRDEKSAEEDLALLLDVQKLKERPAGGLLVTCNGRGERFFGRPSHDATAIQRAFVGPRPGEVVSRGGAELGPTEPLPLAGFFGVGEIGPIGGESHLHGFTACLTLFREMARGG